MHQIPWNKVTLNEFLRLAVLSELEIKVLTLKVKGYSRVKIAFECSVSESTVDKTIKVIRRKYDGVQMFSNILPKRRISKREKIKQGG